MGTEAAEISGQSGYANHSFVDDADCEGIVARRRNGWLAEAWPCNGHCLAGMIREADGDGAAVRDSRVAGVEPFVRNMDF